MRGPSVVRALRHPPSARSHTVWIANASRLRQASSADRCAVPWPKLCSRWWPPVLSTLKLSFSIFHRARPHPPARRKLGHAAGVHRQVGHEAVAVRDRARRIQDLDLKPVDREPLRITPQRHVAEPAVAMGEALLAALDPLDVLGEVD